MILEVKVTPNASKNEILRWEENCLVVKIQGVPERGKVNANLVAFLAKALGIAKTRIEIILGQTSRMKRLKIEGLSVEEVRKILVDFSQ